MAQLNRAWNLESFLDSLIVELDKARETLAVKAINKPLSYAVKDVNLEMQLFPSFDGREVQFLTAQPGQTGASKIAIQLGSITDQQVRQTTKKPVRREDVSIETIEEIDEGTKDTLRKIGVTSVNDLVEIEKKNVDLEKLSNKKVSYRKLAGLLQKAKRGKFPPSIQRASLSMTNSEPTLIIDGDNLHMNQEYEPVAIVNGELAEVIDSSNSHMKVKLKSGVKNSSPQDFILALDPFTVLKLQINNPK